MQRLDGIERCVDWLEALHDIAREETGLDDFGDEHYLEGLKVLLEQYDMDCNLSPVGVYSVRLKLIHCLKQRLIAEQYWKDDPGMFIGHSEDVITWLMTYNAINFCYFPEPGQPRWSRLLRRTTAAPPRLVNLEPKTH